MRIVLLLMLLSSPLAACCPVDKHSLADEADEPLLDILAGRIERNPFDTFRTGLQTRPEAALSTDAEQRVKAALTLWWLGGAGEYTPQRCLDIAGEAAKETPDAAVYSAIVSWAALTESADAESMLPDLFALRFAPNKTSDTDTGELERRGLANAESILLGLMQLDAAWENFDTLFALSLIYSVQGRQNLAHYTRLRAWEMHGQSQHSRVPGAADIADIKPLTILRQHRAGAMVPVKLVSDENLEVIEAQYRARRAYALRWLEARAEYVESHPQSSSAYWAGFTPPKADIPPLRPASAQLTGPTGPRTAAESAAQPLSVETSPRSRNRTWITLGLLLVVLALGAFARARIARKARQPEPPPQAQETA